jgi:hypothetical protein
MAGLMARKMVEPTVVINGAKCSPREAMTLRVALESFAASLSDGLGDDEHGRVMTVAYQSAIDRRSPLSESHA